MTRRENVILVTGLVLAGVLIWWGTRASGVALPAPGRQAEPEPGYPDHIVQPHEHCDQVVHTRHRYPAHVGGEVSAVIHRGFSPMRVPGGLREAQWMVAPPSEVTL